MHVQVSFLSNREVVLRAANLARVGVSGHSLRKGQGTTAAGAKIQANMISVLCRWASDFTNCTLLLRYRPLLRLNKS